MNDDIDRWFPYPEYRPCQRDMLEAAARTVKEGSHSVLMVDAPTGSGKTAILSALLATRKDLRIIVALRTVSQVSVYLDEILKIRQNTDKRPRVAYLVGKAKTCPLRNELDNVYLGCDILKIKTRFLLESEMHKYLALKGQSSDFVYDPSKDSELLELIMDEPEGERSCCPYYLQSREVYLADGVIKFRSSKTAHTTAYGIGDKVIYPDDLSHHCGNLCPYELMAVSAEVADVVILNFNHVFSDSLRETMYGWLGIEPKKCILLIDEAHNLGETVRAVNSDILTRFSVKKAITEVETSRSKVIKAGQKQGLAIAEQILPRILKYMEKMEEKGVTSEEWFDPHMFSDFVFGESLVREDERMVAELMNLAEIIARHKKSESESSEIHLERVGNFLFMLNFAKNDEAFIPLQYTREYKDRKAQRKTYLSTTLEIRNIDPSLQIESVINAHHASILISGTFSPTEAYELYFFGKNDRATIISLPNQFPQENRLIFAASKATTMNIQRNDPDNIKQIKLHLESFISNVPGNVVVYFTSYSLLDQYLDYCTSVAKQAQKRIYLEPRDAGQVSEVLSQFFQAGLKEKVKPGVLLAVTGGKMSEGIDYRGETLKGAMVVGLPLMAYTEIQKSVNDYYKNKYGNKNGMFIAYTLPAMNRALQALGRVLRAADETGVLVLCDMRFASKSKMGIREHLPAWIDREMKVCSGEDSAALITDWVHNRNTEVKSVTPVNPAVPLEIGGSTHEDDTKHAIKCPRCKRDCKFIWQTFEDGSEHIRQECPVHGYIRFAPQIEPYKTIADQTVENDD